MKIKKWLRAGDGLEGIKTTKELLEVAGRRLEKAYAHDIMGDCVFELGDGQVYDGQVVFIFSKARAKYVKEILREDKE